MVNNKQLISKVIHSDQSGDINVFKIFPTIQGEGPFAGKPAVFVRLYGCNLRCPQCDTDYTTRNRMYTPDQLLAQVARLSSPNALVVITGGEPFRQNLTRAAQTLLRSGYKVQIETNGTLFLEGFPYGLVTIVCSPKTGSINSKLLSYIDCFKYVISADDYDAEDGLPLHALEHPAKPRLYRPPSIREWRRFIYLQPVDVQDEAENARHLEVALNNCMQFGYTLCLQLHKTLDLE